jgi:hypothetical protein
MLTNAQMPTNKPSPIKGGKMLKANPRQSMDEARGAGVSALFWVLEAIFISFWPLAGVLIG